MEEKFTVHTAASMDTLPGLVEADAVVVASPVQEKIPPSSLAPDEYEVFILPVRTFVLPGCTKHPAFGARLVSSFDSHWGIVIGRGSVLTFYHLVFDADRPATTDDLHRTVKFEYMSWRRSMRFGGNERIALVGKTQYSFEDCIRVGDLLLFNSIADAP